MNETANKSNAYGCLSDTIVKLTNSATQRQLGKLDIYSLSEFIRRSNVTPATLITALIFVEKFNRIDPKPPLSTEITATELLIIATMAASKFLHDSDTEEALSNDDWARDFDIELKSLNLHEIGFLYALDWKLFVSQDEFDSFITRHLMMNTNSNVLTDKKKYRNSTFRHFITSPHRVSGAQFAKATADLCTRWPMAKAMAVFAAAVLAVSQPPVAMLSGAQENQQFLHLAPIAASPSATSVFHRTPIDLRLNQLTIQSCCLNVSHASAVDLNSPSPDVKFSRWDDLNDTAIRSFNDAYPVSLVPPVGMG